jgi:hypothetical protein
VIVSAVAAVGVRVGVGVGTIVVGSSIVAAASSSTRMSIDRAARLVAHGTRTLAPPDPSTVTSTTAGEGRSGTAHVTATRLAGA